MTSQWLRKIAQLDLEEKILNGGLALAAIGIFLPWIGGRPSLIDTTTRTFTGLGFTTGFIGLAVLCLLTYTLLITLVPLTSSKTILRRERRATVRLCTTALSAILTLAALSVLLKVTLDSPGMEVRFGVYVSLIGSLIASLYAFLAYQEEARREVQGLFHYPAAEERGPRREPVAAASEPAEESLLPPPDLLPSSPPPPPPPPEDHRERPRSHLFRKTEASARMRP